MRFLFIERRRYILVIGTGGQAVRRKFKQEEIMKVWSKPAVREQEVGLEVTSYMPAEIDII
jgi:coenzyme PQQ precursor peptide PqqA